MALKILRRFPQIKPKGYSSAKIHNNQRCIIGNREIVGYGLNGEPQYIDRVDFPMPSIRYKESTPDIMVGTLF